LQAKSQGEEQKLIYNLRLKWRSGNTLIDWLIDCANK
jgi:hypothetical protein